MTAFTALQRAILAGLAEDLATSRPTAAEAVQAALAACDARMMWEATGPFRTGRKLGRTIYNDDDILIGVMDTPELGAMVVEALNRSPAASGPSRAQVWGLIEEMVPQLHEPLRDEIVSAWVDRWMALFDSAPTQHKDPQP